MTFLSFLSLKEIPLMDISAIGEKCLGEKDRISEKKRGKAQKTPCGTISGVVYYLETLYVVHYGKRRIHQI
jgi:hypothetical protein